MEHVKKFFRLLQKGLFNLERLTFFVAGLAMVSLVVSVAYSVVARYIIGNVAYWTAIYTEHVILVIVFLVASRLVKTEEHVITELVLNMLPPIVLQYVHVIRYLIASMASALLLYYSYTTVVDLFQRGLIRFGTSIPVYILMIVMPIGSLLILLRCIEKVEESIAGIISMNKGA